MELDFYPIDIDSLEDNEGNTIVRLFGRGVNGKRVCVIDRKFKPYIWAILKENASEKKAVKEVEKYKEELEIEKIEVKKKKFLAKDVTALKITLQGIKKTHETIKELKQIEEIKRIHGEDIPFVRKYLIDKKITPLILTHVIGKEINAHAEVDLIVEAEEIFQNSEEILKPKILGFDIEVYNPFVIPREKEDPITMISLYGKKYEKVLTWKKIQGAGKYVEVVRDEAMLIQRFLEEIKKYEPDYLTGYFSDGFDFPFIKARAKQHKIKLDLGLDYSQVRLSRRAQTGSARIKGFLHIDIYKFIKKMTRGEGELESYDLNTVSQAMLGDKKTDVNLNDFPKAWDTNNSKELKKYAEYNLKDSELAYRLTEKMLPQLHEMVKLVGQNPYDISRMSMGQYVEWYMIKNLDRFNEITPNRPFYGEIEEREGESYEGGFVYEPQPGLYQEVVGFDFRSLYPSIIITHNICVSTITDDKKNSYETPEINLGDEKVKMRFTKKHKGIIPEILKDILERRKNIKKIMKKSKKFDPVLHARQNGLKLLANSTYGYFGYSGARWYSNEGAGAIAAYARKYIRDAIKIFEKKKFEIIYGDTDSVYLTLGKRKLKDAIKVMDSINKTLPETMELELEDHYKRGIFVMKKGKDRRGAKKKYALIDYENNIRIKGFETVRGDWSPIAREAQQKVLKMILEKNDGEGAVKYVKEVIKKIRNKKIPYEKMIMKKQLKKPIAEYTAIGPHVAVAKKMQEDGMNVKAGSIIKYIVNEGKGIIRERATTPEKAKNYDSEYYINNQVVPAVKPLLEALGHTEEIIKKDHKQKGIMDF